MRKRHAATGKETIMLIIQSHRFLSPHHAAEEIPFETKAKPPIHLDSGAVFAPISLAIHKGRKHIGSFSCSSASAEVTVQFRRAEQIATLEVDYGAIHCGLIGTGIR